MVMVMGEITTTAKIDIPSIVRNTVNRIGYDDPAYGFDGHTCAVLTTIDKQSPDIAQGVNNAYDASADEKIGAGRSGHDVWLRLR